MQPLSAFNCKESFLNSSEILCINTNILDVFLREEEGRFHADAVRCVAIGREENNKYVSFFSSSISISFHPIIIIIVEYLLSIHTYRCYMESLVFIGIIVVALTSWVFQN